MVAIRWVLDAFCGDGVDIIEEQVCKKWKQTAWQMKSRARGSSIQRQEQLYAATCDEAAVYQMKLRHVTRERWAKS